MALLPVLLLALLAHWPSGRGPLAGLDDLLYDLRLQALAPRERSAQVVVLDIDERALAAHGRWPWPRTQLAALLEAAHGAGARLVGLDMVLAEPDRSSGAAALDRLARGPLAGDTAFQAAWQTLRPQLDDDARLADVLAQRPVVLGFHLSNEPGAADVGVLPPPLLPLALLGDAGTALPAWRAHGGNLPALQQAARLGGGHLNAVIDADGTVRRLPLLVAHRDGLQPGIALAMARALLGGPGGAAVLSVEPGGGGPLQALHLRGPGGSLRMPVDAQGQALVPYAAAGMVPQRVPAADLLAGRLPAQALAGKLVLVGVSAPGLIDQRRTPVDAAMFGTLVHAQMLAGLVQAVQPAPPATARAARALPAMPALGPAASVLWLLATGTLLAWALPRLTLARGALLAAAVLAAALGLNLLAWQQAGWVLPLAGALILPPLLLALHLAQAYRRTAGARRQLAQLFGQYVPPELVDEMSRQPERYSMNSRNAELTVLFADVSGFTALAEHMRPEELGAMMNLLFSHLTDVVRDHRGTLDKYIGDSVMAFWGAPLDDPDHARHAVDAAQAMLARLPAIQAEMAAHGWPALQINIGVNSGTVVVGDMGSRHRRAYTVMGDAVNMAARLQAFCSRYGLGLVVGDATHAAMHNAHDTRPWLPLGPLALRGRHAGQPAWQPLAGVAGAEAEAVIADWQALRQLVRSGRPGEALARIDALAAAHPTLGLLCRWQRLRVHEELGTTGPAGSL
ncbi:MAG TPA: adenylate/guanylate cyclase domain-containing protein [Aquabacterium sp.]|nr:adenylate/guanylate cyclase domain-containing protein [Aquabacterium sp.]